MTKAGYWKQKYQGAIFESLDFFYFVYYDDSNDT